MKLQRYTFSRDFCKYFDTFSRDFLKTRHFFKGVFDNPEHFFKGVFPKKAQKSHPPAPFSSELLRVALRVYCCYGLNGDYLAERTALTE